jgi:hypothetical protein
MMSTDTVLDQVTPHRHTDTVFALIHQGCMHQGKAHKYQFYSL